MNANSEYTIGVDLGGTNVRAGLVKSGKIIKHAEALIPEGEKDSNNVIQCIFNTIQKVFTNEARGIGIGVPGLIDKKSGIIHSIVNIPSFNSIPLRNMMIEKFNLPVEINNDVNCFALGEKYFGAGKNFRNMVGLSLGTGMGVGIISGGILLEDANGGSGEFGEIPYLDANFEAYCSGQFFKRTLNNTGENSYKLAESGNEIALQAFEQLGMHIGKAIHIILLTLDPEAIILGGSVSQSKRFFNDAMMKEVHNFIFPNSLKNLHVDYSEAKHSPILGAAQLIINKQEKSN